MRIRAVAFALSLAILALFILVLLSLGLVGPGAGPGDHRLTSINITPEKDKVGSQSAHRKVVVAQVSTAPVHPTPLQKPDATIPPPPPTPGPPGFIHLSHDDMAAADISKMPKALAANNGNAGSGTGSGGGTGAAGKGPGGETAYPVRWYREPTDAELHPYLQAVKGDLPRKSSALIYCRTAAHYHVEDCEIGDESPRGSGLARAYLNASWQFLVRPPTINGAPMLGVWVAIHLEYTTRMATEEP